MGSVYHFTEKMAEAVMEGIVKTGIPVNQFNVSTTPVSYILPSLINFTGVVVAAPTYEGRLYPAMTHVLDMAAFKHQTGKKAIYVGSFGWGGGALRQLTEKIAEMNWELTDSFEFIGQPNSFGLETGKTMGAEFANLLLGR